MPTSLYISSDAVAAVSGTSSAQHVTVQDFAKQSLHAESVVNGVIVNDTAVAAALQQLSKELRAPLGEVRLIIDSSTILTKHMTAPLLSDKKMREMISREFAGVEDYDELMFDYMLLKADRTQGAEMICAAVERGFVGSYLQLLKQQKITVQSIDIALSAVNSLAQLPMLTGKTYILSALDGSSISSYLFDSGKYHVMNRSRLLEERGTAASVAEITKQISSLVQFNAAEKKNAPVTKLYFCNLYENEYKLSSKPTALSFGVDAKSSSAGSLCSAISTALAIEAEPLPADSCIELRESAAKFPLCEFPYNIGNLMNR